MNNSPYGLNSAYEAYDSFSNCDFAIYRCDTYFIFVS